MHMTEEYLESRGIRYRKNVFVPGRTTLLLIHGFSSSASAWALFEPHWESRYNLIIPDLRGHGFSKRYPRFRDYIIERHAEDMRELIRHVGADEYICVGYSLGTTVAVTLSLEDDLRPKAMVLVSPLYQLPMLWRIRLSRPVADALAALTSILPMKLGGGRTDYARFADAGDESPMRVAHDIWHTGLRSYFFGMLQIYAFPGDSWWRKLQCPVLIVWGRRDTVLPEANIRKLAKEVPHVSLEIIEDGSHMLLYHSAEKVSPTIERFVSNL